MRRGGDLAPPQAATARPVRGFLQFAFGESILSWLRPEAALVNRKPEVRRRRSQGCALERGCGRPSPRLLTVLASNKGGAMCAR